MSSFERRDLLLAEELLLLVLDDQKGSVDWRAGNYKLALGAALLCELLLNDIIDVDDTKKHLVSYKSGTSDHPVLLEAIEMVKASSKDRPLQSWVMKFAQIKDIKNKLARELVQLRVLKQDEKDFLLFFTRTVFPERTNSVEEEIKKRVDEALHSNLELAPRDGLLVALMSSTGILNLYYSSKERRAFKNRVKEIVNGSCIGKETDEAIKSIQAAQVVAAVVPAIVATTVASN